MTRRHVTYFVLRGAAALVFVAAGLLMPPGVPAAMVIMGAGIVGVLTCVGTNAGAVGEREGSRAQQRWLESVRAPQGEWPPYHSSTVDGEVVRRSEATLRPPTVP